MFDQTFSLLDIPRVITLIFLEALLSIDNAFALALILKRLPQEKRKKALFIGVFSSLILRAIGVLSAAYLIKFFWVKLLGGLYLIYLASSYFFRKYKSSKKELQPKSFWKTVVLIELTDFIFAIDSILAGLAMVGVIFHPPQLPPKIWIVYVGGIAGLICMRFTAQIFTNLIERFPKLERGAHFIVGWIGLKLILETISPQFPVWAEWVFWLGIISFFSLGFNSKKTDK